MLGALGTRPAILLCLVLHLYQDTCLALICFVSFHGDTLVLGPSRDSKLG